MRDQYPGEKNMIEDSNFTVTAYNKYLSERRIMGSRCGECGEFHLPARPICSSCQNRSMDWAELNGHGKVIGLTSVEIAPSGMVERGFGRSNPYVSAIIALDDGPSVAARIEGLATNKLSSSMSTGMSVVADFLEETVDDKKRVILIFRPA